MGESISSFVLEKLSWVLEQREKLFGGGRDEFDSVNSVLKLAEEFINESRGKHNEHEFLKVARRRLRDIAHEAEDMMDTLKFEDLRRRNLVRRIIRFVSYPMMCHDASQKIEGFKQEIDKILDFIQKKRAESSPDATADATPDRHRRVPEERDVVGFAIDSAKLEKQLMEGDSKLGVISIIGMGGSGKTTLAWKIYNTPLVKGHFVCRIWVHASYQFSTQDLLREMLRFAIRESYESINGALEDTERIKRRRMKEIGDMSEDELKEKLSKYLEGKRYLVVMDNIWRTDVWNELNAAFPDNSNGSRILITSRIKRVASGISLSTPHFPPILDEDESWELFSQVFRGENFLPELETVGKRIVNSCEGLPLSIVELGGLAAVEEKTHRTLSKYVGNVNSYLCSKTRCKDILSSSYTHLSQHLKSCFLYFGVYPEEFEIPVRQLIQLWIAEGFIQDKADFSNIEDVAENYFDELCDQSLIRVASRRTYRGAKTCRINALLRHISICEGKEEKFLEVIRHVNRLFENESRRISVQCSTHYISSDLFRATRARSLLFFRQKELSFDSSNKKKQTYGDLDPNHWKWVHENFCLVRVLHFGQLNIYSIPSNIEELICLRYLRIKSNVLKVIPASICNLKHLETLDLKGTYLNCLPIGIWNLRSLRNLYMSGPVSLPNHLNPDVKALWKLQVLSTVSLNPQNVSLIVQSELLRKLGIWFASDDSNCRAVEVLTELHDLPHLQTLKVVNCSEGLRLHRLPTSLPSTITKITLRQVCLKGRRDMSVLGKLPNLYILKLQSCLISSKLTFFAESFPRLEVLKLEKLKIKRWKQRRRAMPCLRHLVIKRCTNLNMVPSRLWSSNAMHDVEVLWSNLELVTHLQESHRNLGFNLDICPPPDDEFYQRRAV